MKGQLKVATPTGYLAALEGERKKDITALHRLIRKTAPKLTPFIHSGMLAYGPFHYRYASGREGDWFKVGIASNAQYISLYACALDELCTQEFWLCLVAGPPYLHHKGWPVRWRMIAIAKLTATVLNRKRRESVAAISFCFSSVSIPTAPSR